MKFKLLPVMGILIILTIIAVPRLLSTGRFVTADEPTFAKDSANFYYAVSHRDPGSTYQSGYPGVTTMAIGALAYRLVFPDYSQVGEPSTGDKHLLIAFYRHGPAPIELLSTARQIQSLVIMVVLGVSFLFAYRIYLMLPAALGFLFIAFNGYFLAHSRILHTNALLASFMFLSVLAFLNYLKFQRWYALVVSSLAAALSVLTVTTGMTLLPVIAVIALVDLVWTRGSKQGFKLIDLIKRYLVPVLLWGLIAFLFVGLLFPSMWVNPLETVKKVFDFTVLSAQGASSFSEAAGSQSSTMGQGTSGVLFYVRAYLWRSSPVIWIGLMLAMFFLISRKSRALVQPQIWGVGMLIIYVSIYFVVMSIGVKKFDRYLLPIFLPLDLVAGLGWTALGIFLVSSFDWFRRIRLQFILAGLLVILQAALVIQHHPYYLTYTNPLLGRPDQVPADMFTGWGEGLSEAAIYLREQPDFDQLEVIAWYPLAFNWYSQGIGFNAMPIYANPEVDPDHLDEYLKADYAVIYINQWQRGMTRQLLDVLQNYTPEQVISIDDVEYVRIYNLK